MLEPIFPFGVNVYTPLYSQLNVATLSTLSGGEVYSFIMKTPCEDIFAAFDYYLKNVNKGQRPFILFGHSQGAQIVSELATAFLGNEEYAEYIKNHIATYAIGISVTEEEIARNPDLKFSQSPDDTGVILTWNATSPSEIASGAYKSFATWKTGALATNPVSWLAYGKPAGPVTVSVNYISLFGPVSIEGSINVTADNERGLLMVSGLDEDEYTSGVGELLGRYHGFDILFFADSIAKNISDRITAFCK